MQYPDMKTGIFLKRPNRFIAHVEIDEQMEICHVKNTGRCRELLIPGATLLLEPASNPNRKTKYSVIGVYKGDTLINMDSQAPNQVAEEWIRTSGHFPNVTFIKREKTYRNSRFDLYFEYDGKKAFMEVKGCTLEEDGVARFPDAPTERGIKHIKELAACLNDGYEAYILFVIQMKGITHFEPNDRTHKAFGDALRAASATGVHVLAMDCIVTENSLEIDQPVEVKL